MCLGMIVSHRLAHTGKGKSCSTRHEVVLILVAMLAALQCCSELKGLGR